jgi:hypothetical protein
MHNLFEGYFGCDGYIHKGLRPVAAEIAHGAYFAVGYGYKRTAGIAQNGASQCQVFNTPRDVSNLDGIAYCELIFENDIESSDHVANEILRAKTNSDAGKACKRQGGRWVDANLVHGSEQGDKPNDLASRAVKHPCERARLLLANLSSAAQRGGRLYDQLGQNAEKAVNEQRNKKYGYEFKDGAYRDFGPVDRETGHRFFGKESITLDRHGCAPEESSILSSRPEGEADMSDTRRRFLTVLSAGTIVMMRAASLSGQAKPSSRPPSSDPKSDMDSSDAVPEKSPTKAILEANEKDIKKNIEKLYQLATDLKEEVEKTDSSKVLSLLMVKKAEEIERLARDIKTRAKG